MKIEVDVDALEAERASLQARLQELDAVLKWVKRQPLRAPNGTHSEQSPTQLDGPYSGMILKDAVLAVLKTETEGIRTGEIATKIKAGGFRSRAANFAQNVSACLSNMRKNTGEVELQDGQWTLKAISSTEPEQPA
jgi:hypothetical protein